MLSLLAVGGIALTGCGTATLEEPKPIEGIVFESQWTEDQLRGYMSYVGARSMAGFDKDQPEGNIVAVANPKEGVIHFEVKDLDYESNGWFLEGFAVNFMQMHGCAADDIQSVIIETTGGSDIHREEGCR